MARYHASSPVNRPATICPRFGAKEVTLESFALHAWSCSKSQSARSPSALCAKNVVPVMTSVTPSVV
eukprot:29935-Pelagococcus_subviridis.AAC.1